MENVRDVDPQRRREPNVREEMRTRPNHDMTGMLLHLQRTAGNRAVSAYLHRQTQQDRSQRLKDAVPEQDAEQGEGLQDVLQGTVTSAQKQSAGQPLLVQRNGVLGAIKDAVTGVVGSDRMIANTVAKGSGRDYADEKLQDQYKAAQKEAKSLEAKRQAEIKANGASDINPDDAYNSLPAEYRPAPATSVSEKAVRANKAAFLEEDVLTRAEKQRKVNDIHAIRVRKLGLSNQLEKAPKGSAGRAAIKAKLEVLEDQGDVAKLNPQVLDDKLQKAGLKAQLAVVEGKEGKWKGLKLGPSKLKGDQKAAAALAKAMIKGELKDIKGRKEQLGKLDKNSELWETKLTDANADKAGTALDAGSSIADAGAGTTKLAKEIAHQVGNTGVSGESHIVDGHKVVDSVGTAQQGAAVEDALSDLLSLGSQLASAASIAKAYQEGDPAEQQKAVDDAIDLGFSLSKGLASLGKAATNLAADFGNADMATQMAAEVLPGFDIAAASLSLINHSVILGMAADRLKSQGSHIKQAREASAEHIALSIGQFKKQNKALVATSSVDLTADLLKIVGSAISLSGIGIIVGHPIKLVGMTVSLLNKAGTGVYGAYKAGKQQQAQAADMLALPGAAEKLLKHDRKHGIQTLIREAREGDGKAKELALKEMANLGIDEKTLKGSSDRALRDLALSRMNLKEDSKTIGQSLKEGVEGAKEFLHEDTGNQIKVLGEVKNKLRYGGEKDRGIGWKLKMRLGADVAASTASIHKILIAMSDAERKELGITQADLDATRTQFEREQKSDTRQISAPQFPVVKTGS